MRLGPLTVAVPFAAGPLEEHSTPPFRLLARRCGAGLVWSERIDGTALAEGDRRQRRQLVVAPGERPVVGQISAATPEVAAAAAREIEGAGFAAVDLNCDCPAGRVAARGEGGALMCDPALIGRLVAAMATAVRIPVLVKLRRGPAAGHETAVAAAQAAASAGAAAVTLHARWVDQGYRGEADWAIIAEAVRAVAIPVLGSGSVRSAADAVRMLRETGCAGVVVGRGCLGHPWIFREAEALRQGRSCPPPTADERVRALLEVVDGEWKILGAPLAGRRLARWACYFAQHLPAEAFREFRSAVQTCDSPPALQRLARQCF